MAHPNQLKIEPSDIRQSTSSLVIGNRRARDSRRGDTRSVTMTLEHAPTSITVQGEIPPGHYSRNELRELQQRLRAVLEIELEKKVLAELRRRRREQGA